MLAPRLVLRLFGVCVCVGGRLQAGPGPSPVALILVGVRVCEGCGRKFLLIFWVDSGPDLEVRKMGFVCVNIWRAAFGICEIRWLRVKPRTQPNGSVEGLCFVLHAG